ncbi:MAG TPA: SpoIIE family protein phosphatase [Candidatus Acidoferrales bacterium]|nr:SpoIIE family protein phosphatase [Candidatus Acidoferrales bacterium]
MPIEKPEWLLQTEGILETLNQGVMVVDDCHRVFFINNHLEEIFGIPAEEMIGRTALQWYGPEENKFLLARIAESELAGQHQFEFVVPRKDGSRLPVVITTRRFEDPDGRMYAIVTFTDISDQKRAEAMLREANTKLEERQRQIDEDLTLAARVQQSLAPQSLVWGGLRVDAYYHPVRRIGGDFGVVSPVNNENLNLLVCDVSGHGIGSALVANRLYTEILAELRNNAPLGDMLRRLNQFVLQSIGGSAFYFTAAAARIDRGGRRMVFAGAGHPPTMIVTPGQEPRLLESRSMLLGALPDAVDGEAVLDIDLNPGDRVMLYTDGLTEVFNSSGEMLDVSGLQSIVRDASVLPFSEMKRTILDRVTAWRSGPPADDMSLVLVEVA